MFRASTFLANEGGWQLLALAGLVAAIAVAAAVSLLARARCASGAARLAWLAGTIVVLACGAGAAYFIMIGVHSAPPTVLRRAMMVAGITLVILITCIIAAFVDRRLAEKNEQLD